MGHVRDQFCLETFTLHPLFDRMCHAVADMVDLFSLFLKYTGHTLCTDLIARLTACNFSVPFFNWFNCTQYHRTSGYKTSFSNSQSKRAMSELKTSIPLCPQKCKYQHDQDHFPEKPDIFPDHPGELSDFTEKLVTQGMSPPFPNFTRTEKLNKTVTTAIPCKGLQLQ